MPPFIRRHFVLFLAALTLASCSRPTTPPAADAGVPEPLVLPSVDAPTPTADATPAPPSPTNLDASAVQRIRDEGLNRSQVMQTLSYLTDVIGPRLTGSPNLRRANEWTKTKLTEWGLQNAQLEPWGTFGRGWSLKRFSAQVVE